MTVEFATLDQLVAASPLASEEIPDLYRGVRRTSELICAPLEAEDCCVQSMPDVSPTKWHLAHTSWFFETFVLETAIPNYRSPHPEYAFLFNSYYNAVGPQHSRPEGGVLSRPTVAEVMSYRRYVDEAMASLFESSPSIEEEILPVIEQGLHHEQQHQELMLMDIKHVFSCNPLRPGYRRLAANPPTEVPELGWIPYDGSLQWIGHEGDAFAYDNEAPPHRTYIESFRIANRLTTCAEYLEFMEDGGYEHPELWLSDGWNTVKSEGWNAPLYWNHEDGRWCVMTLAGMRPLDPNEPVSHVSFYEADAFARWSGCWLPREGAWESVARSVPIEGNLLEQGRFHPVPHASTDPSDVPAQMFGDVWEWTCSPYTPYPGYRPVEGALGEYNGKFMCNQMVLRGGSCVTPASHIRATYRNFFPPDARWPFTGIRLARGLD